MQLGGLCRILGQFPGLLGIDELVHPVGQRHDGAHCLGVVALLVQLGQGVGARPAFGKGCQRGWRGRCQSAVEALQDEAGRAAGDVDQLAHQIAVDPGHEVLGVEVHVLDPAVELGRQVVAQPFRVHAQLQVFLRRQARSARFGHLFAGDGEESVHEDVVGRVHAGKLQHGRPEQRMEVDDVLADEMHLPVRPLRILTGLRVDEGIEVQTALLAQRLQRGQVAHRGVQPHVEVLARRIRDGNAEVGLIARDVPVGQRVAGAFALGRFPIGCIAAQPFARLVGHLGLQPALRQPVMQELAAARIGQAEEIVLGAADDRRAAGQRGIGVDEVGGGVDLAADLAGVAVLVLGVAVGALALDVAVRQEHLLHRIEELLDGARGHQARRFQPPVDLLRQRRVLGRMGGVPVVEADVIAVQIVRSLGGDACHQFFGCDALGLGLQHDRCAVGIVGPHEQHVLAQHALEAHPDVSLDVLHDVADVERSVGVGQGGGDEQTLGMLAGGGRHGGGCRCGGWLGLAHENAGEDGQDARMWRARCPVKGARHAGRAAADFSKGDRPAGTVAYHRRTGTIRAATVAAQPNPGLRRSAGGRAGAWLPQAMCQHGECQVCRAQAVRA